MRHASFAFAALGLLLALSSTVAITPLVRISLEKVAVSNSWRFSMKQQRTKRIVPSFNSDVVDEVIVGLRGGGEESAVVSSLALADALSFTGAALLGAFTILLVKKVPRSGGHAPAPIISLLASLGVGEGGATGLFHLAYVLHCFGVVAIMPRGLKDALFSPAGVVLLGTVFPLVESIKAAARGERGAAVSQSWLMYWVMNGVFSAVSHDMGKVIARHGPKGGKHWYEFQFYTVLWLILPFTDGAAIIYELATKPYIVPIVAPIAKAAEGWLTTVALTLINASHMWFVVFLFMAMPTVLKRSALIATGTAYPVLATIVAIATENDGIADDKWLTYWSCFSLVYLGMIAAERFVGKVPGLYTLCLAITLYLMLPIFEGSDAVFRKILVPIFRQREALLLKDAKKLAKDMVRQLPAGRHAEAGKAAATAFLEEANKLAAAKPAIRG